MKPFYLDTNVFISKYKLDDPHHKSAESIIAALEEKTVEAYTSVLTILEVAATASRAYDGGSNSACGADPKMRRGVFISALLKRLVGLRIHFLHLKGDIPMRTVGDIVLPSLFKDALTLSFKVGLKSFDLVHLSAAKYAKETLEVQLTNFVTSDKDFLTKRRALNELLDISFYVSR